SLAHDERLIAASVEDREGIPDAIKAFLGGGV
ncbi:MAG: hypothetical protein ACI9F9_003304, partial [Candidatus Paceibacteria bacterium]